MLDLVSLRASHFCSDHGSSVSTDHCIYTYQYCCSDNTANSTYRLLETVCWSSARVYLKPSNAKKTIPVKLSTTEINVELHFLVAAVHTALMYKTVPFHVAQCVFLQGHPILTGSLFVLFFNKTTSPSFTISHHWLPKLCEANAKKCYTLTGVKYYTLLHSSRRMITRFLTHL